MLHTAPLLIFNFHRDAFAAIIFIIKAKLCYFAAIWAVIPSALKAVCTCAQIYKAWCLFNRSMWWRLKLHNSMWIGADMPWCACLKITFNSRIHYNWNTMIIINECALILMAMSNPFRAWHHSQIILLRRAKMITEYIDSRIWKCCTGGKFKTGWCICLTLQRRRIHQIL